MSHCCEALDVFVSALLSSEHPFLFTSLRYRNVASSTLLKGSPTSGDSVVTVGVGLVGTAGDDGRNRPRRRPYSCLLQCKRALWQRHPLTEEQFRVLSYIYLLILQNFLFFRLEVQRFNLCPGLFRKFLYQQILISSLPFFFGF